MKFNLRLADVACITALSLARRRTTSNTLTSTKGSLHDAQVPLLCCPVEGLHWVLVHHAPLLVMVRASPGTHLLVNLKGHCLK